MSHQDLVISDLPECLQSFVPDGLKAWTYSESDSQIIEHPGLIEAWTHIEGKHLLERMFYDGFCSMLRLPTGLTFIRVRTTRDLTYLAYATPPAPSYR